MVAKGSDHDPDRHHPPDGPCDGWEGERMGETLKMEKIVSLRHEKEMLFVFMNIRKQSSHNFYSFIHTLIHSLNSTQLPVSLFGARMKRICFCFSQTQANFSVFRLLKKMGSSMHWIQRIYQLFLSKMEGGRGRRNKEGGLKDNSKLSFLAFFKKKTKKWETIQNCSTCYIIKCFLLFEQYLNVILC